MDKCAIIDTRTTWRSWGIGLWTDSDRDVHAHFHISDLNMLYSPDEWEMLISLNHRLSTDASVSGEVNNRVPHSATSRVKADSQAFQELRTLWLDNGSHRHSGARRGTFSVLGGATQMISLLLTMQYIHPLSLGGAALGILWSSTRKKGQVNRKWQQVSQTFTDYTAEPATRRKTTCEGWRVCSKFCLQNKHATHGTVRTKMRVLLLPFWGIICQAKVAAVRLALVIYLSRWPTCARLGVVS